MSAGDNEAGGQGGLGPEGLLGGSAKRQVRSRAWAHLQQLARWPHRGSTTGEEQQAAEYVAGVLRGLGVEAEVQRFPAPRATLYGGPPVVGAILLAAAAASLWGPPLPAVRLVAAVVSLAAILPLLGEMLGSRRNLDLFLGRTPSQNVYAILPGTGAAALPEAGGKGPGRAPAARTVVLSAHLDTQLGTFLFSPGFRPFLRAYFTVAYAGFFGVPVGLVLRALAAEGAALGQAGTWIAAVAAVVVAAAVASLLAAWAGGRHVPGLNDNGTGVAIALATAERFCKEPIPGLELRVLITGAEEVGTRGMLHFLERPGSQEALPKGSTFFLNLDNLGGGRLRYLLKEGMLVPFAAGATLRKAAERVAAGMGRAERTEGAQPGTFTPWPRPLLLTTDGLIPASRGYETLTLIGLDDRGGIPNYHWFTDTLENVDAAFVAHAEEVVWRLLQELAPGRMKS